MANERMFSVLTLSMTLSQSWLQHFAVQDPCARVMAVASAAKTALLPGSILDDWQQVGSTFWKWRLMTTAAPIGLIIDPSV